MATGFDYLCPTAPRLTGEGGVRHCEHCRKDVHDLSLLTRPEAIVLLTGPDMPCVELTVERGRARFRSGSSMRRFGRVGALAGVLASCGGEAPPDPRSAGDLLTTAAQRLDELVAEAEADARAAAQARAQARALLAQETRAAEEAAQRAAAEQAAADAACAEAKAKARKEKQRRAERDRLWDERHRTMGAPRPLPSSVAGHPRPARRGHDAKARVQQLQ